jgi:hypothetical protein
VSSLLSRRRVPNFAFLAITLLIASCNRNAEAIAPDFEVNFACNALPNERLIEDFAGKHAFSVVNEERARREHEKGFFPLKIDSYDTRRRMLDVIGLREPPSHGGGIHYRLTILGPPPTVHDPALERAALDLVRDALHCRVEFSRSFDNGPEATILFERIFKDEQRRIVEFGGKRRLP